LCATSPTGIAIISLIQDQIKVFGEPSTTVYWGHLPNSLNILVATDAIG